MRGRQCNARPHEGSRNGVPREVYPEQDAGQGDPTGPHEDHDKRAAIEQCEQRRQQERREVWPDGKLNWSDAVIRLRKPGTATCGRRRRRLFFRAPVKRALSDKGGGQRRCEVHRLRHSE